MANTPLQFAAIVDAWCKEQPSRMEAVWKEASQRTVSMAQENLQGHIDTGFHRASVRASLDAMPLIDPGAHPVKGQSYSYNDGPVVSVIASADLGKTIFVGWTAAYSGFLEYGTSRMPPVAYVGRAAESWSATVSQVAGEARARAGR